MSINLSEDQIREMYRCYKDPVYFITNYIWLELKEKSTITQFELFDYQEKILSNLANHKNMLILKSRRVGASTVVAAFAAWLVNFRRGVNILFISRKEEMAIKLLDKVKFMLRNLKKHDNPNFELATDASWMLNDLREAQQNLKVNWHNNDGDVVSKGEVWSLTTTADSARGDSATFVFVDELASLPDQEELMGSALLTAMKGGNWIAVSTPKGVGNMFHAMCMQAERGEDIGAEFLKVHWRDTDITEEQLRAVLAINSEDIRMQEMEMAFLSSGDPVFSPVHLAACYKPIKLPSNAEVKEAIEHYKTLDRSLFPFYTGVDTAVGKLTRKDSKRDYHSFTALTKSGIQAFAYHSKDESLTDWTGSLDSQPGIGESFIEGTVSRLHRQYPGILEVEINGPGQMTYNNHRLPQDSFSIIVPKNTTIKSKSQLISQLIIAIETHSIIITDQFTYECLSYYQRGAIAGQFSAPPGNFFDDPVISLALAWDALLRDGAMEFPWGSTSDQLKTGPLDQVKIDEYDSEKANFGPALLKKNNNERLVDNFNDKGAYFDPMSGIDISRLRSPELEYV